MPTLFLDRTFGILWRTCVSLINDQNFTKPGYTTNSEKVSNVAARSIVRIAFGVFAAVQRETDGIVCL